ncbi:MAG: alpha/beta hydrolase, partial [Verrucomicrobiae bacterium]|nr:alpha/beta hydrolase [Verrucomicrobiae bacterium]
MKTSPQQLSGRGITALAAAGILWLGTGCTTAKYALPSHTDIPELAQLRERYDALDRQLHLVPTDRNGHIVNVAVHELRGKATGSVVVLIHGCLSNHETWQFVAPCLARFHEVWLIDLPGCGDSDKPRPKDLPPDGYSPVAMADRVMEALTARLEARRLQGQPVPALHLVGHSLGGSVVLRMVMEPELRERYPDTLARVDDLLLMAPCDVGLNAPVPAFLPIVDLKSWQVTVGNWLGMVRQRTYSSVAGGYNIRNRALREDAELLHAILSNRDTRQALQAMLEQAVPWDRETLRPEWPEIERQKSLYDNIDRPCLIVWGQRDEVLPEWMGHHLRDEIPGAQLVELALCGHSIPREWPDKAAAIIEDFIRERPRQVCPLRLTRGPDQAVASFLQPAGVLLENND